jgi:hypothetical protein
VAAKNGPIGRRTLNFKMAPPMIAKQHQCSADAAQYPLAYLPVRLG